MNQQLNIRFCWLQQQNKRELIIRQELMFLEKHLVFPLKESSMTSKLFKSFRFSWAVATSVPVDGSKPK